MKFNLFTCDHKRSDFIYKDNSIFKTLVSGHPLDAHDGIQSDLAGVNIAEQNSFSEMRHQFFVWKNLLPTLDYVGFEHYRRNFFILPYRAAELNALDAGVFDTYRRATLAVDHVDTDVTAEVFAGHQVIRSQMPGDSQIALKQIIQRSDIITARPFVWSLKAYWNMHFPNWSYDVMIEAMNSTSYFRHNKKVVGDDLNYMFSKNMYAMRSELFDEYMKFFFECCEYISQKETIVPRMLGYYAEVLFSFWVCQKRVENPALRITQAPILVLK